LNHALSAYLLQHGRRVLELRDVRRVVSHLSRRLQQPADTCLDVDEEAQQQEQQGGHDERHDEPQSEGDVPEGALRAGHGERHVDHLPTAAFRRARAE
jgi:hypothetical protein